MREPAFSYPKFQSGATMKMPSQDILKVIVRHSLEVLPELESHEFRSGDQLRDLGANSLDRAEIITLVLESLRLNIPRVEAFGATTIGELADLLHDKM
jgi:polyketide biosynthesis acyl carrier protein